MKRLYGLALVIVVAALGCKGDEVSAHVHCKVTTASTVDCSVAQTKGTAEIEVCWEFNVACANGARLDTAPTCTKVKDGQTATVTIPADKIKVAGDCQGEMKPSLTNTTLNGKKVQLQ